MIFLTGIIFLSPSSTSRLGKAATTDPALPLALITLEVETSTSSHANPLLWPVALISQRTGEAADDFV